MAILTQYLLNLILDENFHLAEPLCLIVIRSVVVSVAVIKSVVGITEFEFAVEAPYGIVDDIFIQHCQFKQIGKQVVVVVVVVAEKYIYILYQHISFTLSIKRIRLFFSYLML